MGVGIRMEMGSGRGSQAHSQGGSMQFQGTQGMARRKARQTMER